MATGERIDPYAGFNFLVEIDGITRAAFSECSGLSTDTDPIEYRDGSEDITVRKIPGLKKFANISLKRGMTKDMELWTRLGFLFWKVYCTGSNMLAGLVQRF